MVKPAMDSSCNDSSCDSSSKMYKGVRKRKWGKWVSEIRLPNSRERIWLGSYDTQEKAARAFDAALYCLRGKTATFNFPDTPHNLETNVVLLPHQSLSPQQIQELAAKFANNDPPMDPASQEHEPSSNNTTETTLDTVQVDLFDPTDWTFFNTLDDLNNGSDFGLGEFLCSTQTPLLFHDNGEEIEGDDYDDAFSNHSFLWSWNF